MVDTHDHPKIDVILRKFLLYIELALILLAPQGPDPSLWAHNPACPPVLKESCRELGIMTRSVHAMLIPRLSILLHQPHSLGVVSIPPTSSGFSLFV